MVGLIYIYVVTCSYYGRLIGVVARVLTPCTGKFVEMGRSVEYKSQ